jgi:glycosyltransferase involved in cell wall biosynthesis
MTSAMERNHSTTAGRFVLVTPARNEERFIQRTIDSVVGQTHRPIRWIIVDDGSTDDTAAIARRVASRHPWISLVSRGDRGHRKLGGGVIEAFNHGLAQVDEPWDFVAKMDADRDSSSTTGSARRAERSSDPRPARTSRSS